MEEKIGMYTKQEIFDYMTDGEGSMLGRSMYDAIMRQLQAYKDREDKFREYIKHEYFKREQIGIYNKTFQEFEVNKILQILNEGGKIRDGKI